jgi:ParB/RepB/Spo0J family partition protein
MSTKKTSRENVDAAFDRMNLAPGSAPLLDRVQPKEVAAPVHTTRALEQLTRQVLLAYIDLDAKQVRQTIDPAELDDLTDSIRQFGVLQYVTLQKLPDTDRYRVIAGHRRVLAAGKAGLDAIPAVIRPETYDDQQRMLEQLVENTQRVNLTPVEEARRYQLLMDSFSLSQPKLAKLISRPQSRIAEHVGILRIPEQLLERGKTLAARVLIDISKEPASEIPRLIDLALKSPSPLKDVAENRTTRKTRSARPGIWREEFPVVDRPPVEIRWKVDPNDGDVLKELVHALEQIVAQLASRQKRAPKK